jgi:hypothetical protein
LLIKKETSHDEIRQTWHVPGVRRMKVLRSIRHYLPVSLILYVLLGAGGCAKPVTSPPPPPAPEAAAKMAAAKSVFVSNLGSDNDSAISMRGANAGYESFRKALQQWGRWTLASSPNQADLIIEIQATEIPPVSTRVGFRGPDQISQKVYPAIIAITLRPSTSQSVLWTTNVAFSPTAVSANGVRKQLDQSIGKLISQLKAAV